MTDTADPVMACARRLAAAECQVTFLRDAVVVHCRPSRTSKEALELEAAVCAALGETGPRQSSMSYRNTTISSAPTFTQVGDMVSDMVTSARQSSIPTVVFGLIPVGVAMTTFATAMAVCASPFRWTGYFDVVAKDTAKLASLKAACSAAQVRERHITHES